jgi:predicted phosphodiesterase
MAIYVTGDTHGKFSKISNRNFKIAKKLTKKDYLIILGDFGLLWEYLPSKEEKYWLKFLNSRNFVVLFIDGNHEHHIRLKNIPEIKMFNGKVGKVSDNIFHLKRGEIYTIDNKKIFCFGGAKSVDKHLRIEHISWWKEELPTYEEINHAFDNLEKNDYTVDYIFAHSAPIKIVKKAFPIYFDFNCPTGKLLDEICNKTNFKHFYCGHFHENLDFENYHFIYDQVMLLD